MVRGKSPPIRAVVGEINHGPSGEYAVAFPIGEKEKKKMGSVTFSLDPRTWRGDGRPKLNMVVLLFGCYETPKGWRANRARPVRLSDQSQKKATRKRIEKHA